MGYGVTTRASQQRVKLYAACMMRAAQAVEPEIARITPNAIPVKMADQSRIDEAAERIRQLGYPTPGTMTEFLQLTSLTEYPGDYPNASVMIGNILEDHEAVVRYVRLEIEREECCNLDVGTLEFLTSLIRDHEKMAWVLRATLYVVGDRASA